jgi:methionyl-tRNA formyltransferase
VRARQSGGFDDPRFARPLAGRFPAIDGTVPAYSYMTSLRIIFAASGEFAVPTLRALVEAGNAIVQVVTQPDRPAGRGRVMTSTPTGQAAEALGLRVVRTEDINALSGPAGLLPPADVMVVIAFGQKIADAVVHRPRLGSINLHASRLPLYRGAAPINWAILSGDTITGNSVIRLAQKMDAGAVLAQSEIAIGELETAGELHDRLAVDGVPLVLGVLQSLAEGAAVATEQDPAQATLAKKLSREAARIDWNRDAQHISRQARGMYPWPGCRVQLIEEEKVLDVLTLVRARVAAATTVRADAGTAVEDGHLFGVAAGDGRIVEVVELQPAGKRPMSMEAYRRGHRWQAGMRLQSI